MADRNDNKSETSPSPTPSPPSTSTFIPSSTLTDRPSFETAEGKQRISSALSCSQGLLDSSERSIPTEVRAPDQLQASNPAKPGRFADQPHSFFLNRNAISVTKEDQSSSARSKAALRTSPLRDTQDSRTQRSTAILPGKESLPQDTDVPRPGTYPAVFPNTVRQEERVPSSPRSLPSQTGIRVASALGFPSPSPSLKPETRSSRVQRSQSLRSLHSANSFRVPTRLSSLRSDTSVATDSFDTDIRPQASVPSFLGRHRTSQNTNGVQRTVSLGSIAELHSTAQQSYSNRNFSLPSAKQRRSSLPAVRQTLGFESALTKSRNASIASVEDLRVTTEPALLIDIAKRPNLDVLVRSPPSPHHPIPLSYRCSNSARPSTARKEAAYVPLFVNHRLRPTTTSSMFGHAEGYLRLDDNWVLRPSGLSESTEELLGPDQAEVEEEEEGEERPVAGPVKATKGWRKWLRVVKDFGRAVVGMPPK